MGDSNPKLLIEVSSSRELNVRLYGTPESLRYLATSLIESVDALPSPLTGPQAIYLKDFGFGDAKGSKRETYLSFHADPSPNYLPARGIRRTVWDWLVVLFAVALLIFAVLGFMVALKWIAARI